MKYLYILLFLFFFAKLYPQSPCKKVLVEACIDGRSRLHIKSGKLFWQHLYELPPGVHENCVGPTKINGAEWKDWQTNYILSYTTDALDVETTVLQKHDISQLLQKPTAANSWETIWEFNDPAGSSHYYSVSFEFCPAKKEKDKPAKVKKKETKKEIVKTDSLKPKEAVIEEPSFYKIYFDPAKATLIKASADELSQIYEGLKTNSTIIEIFGYTKTQSSQKNELKLYDERAMVICNYLIGKGLDQKRIQYIGYGDKNIANTEKVKQKRLELKILESK